MGEAPRLLKPNRLVREEIGVRGKNGSLGLMEAMLVIEQSDTRPAAILAEEAELTAENPVDASGDVELEPRSSVPLDRQIDPLPIAEVVRREKSATIIR